MKYIIDVLALLGLAFIGFGVFLVYGIGWSLIVCGIILIKFAYISAWVNRNAFDSEETEGA